MKFKKIFCNTNILILFFKINKTYLCINIIIIKNINYYYTYIIFEYSLFRILMLEINNIKSTIYNIL